MADRKRIVVGITGASGALYARRLVECLVEGGAEVHLVISTWGRRLIADELGIGKVTAASLVGRETDQVVVHSYQDVGSPLSSGSFLTHAMIVCPCSSHTLAELAAGIGDALIARAAAVTLKEHRRLIVVPREMPTSPIDLKNMVRLSDAGAIICPANPGFYMKPTSIQDLVDFVVGKLLDLVGVEHQLNTRWAGASGSSES